MSRLRARYRARNTGGFSAKEFLDIYGQGAIHAWSTVLLKSGVTDGTDLRRSSDGAEDTFGYAEGILDEVGIESFVGGGNGFNKTLYDQVGNLDLAQAIDTRQPQLVSAGEMNKVGDIPFIYFTDTGGGCHAIQTSLINEISPTGSWSFDIDFTPNNAGNTRQTFFVNTFNTSGTRDNYVAFSRLGSNIYVELNDSGTLTGGYFNATLGTRYKMTVVVESGIITAWYVNGAAISFTAGSYGGGNSNSYESLDVGGIPGSGAITSDINYSTLIFYDEAKDLAHHQAFNDFFF